MEFRLPYGALPEERDEYKRNELAVTQDDVRRIAEDLGPVIAANAEIVAQQIREQGGINPSADDLLFPSSLGRAGDMDNDQLIRIMTNHIVWRDTNPL